MEIKEIREYYIEEWKLRLEELNELGLFIQSLNDNNWIDRGS
jgi:hypothetical protein